MVNNSYTPYQAYEVESQPNLRATLQRYLRFWPWFLLSIVLALGAAYAYLLYQPPVYRVHASLLIKDEKKGGLSAESLMKELYLFNKNVSIDDQIEILKSYTLMDRVVKSLGLDIQYHTPTPTYAREVYAESPIRLTVEKANPQLLSAELKFTFVDNKTFLLNGFSYPFNQSIKTPYGLLRVFALKPITASTLPITVSVLTHSRAVNSYLDKLSVEPAAKESNVLELSLEETVPDKGEAVLNQLVNAYSKEAIFDKNKDASNMLNFIEERLALIAGELSKVEQEVESYKSTQGITDLSVQAQTFLMTVKENDAQLNEVNMRLSGLADIEKYVAKQTGDKSVAPATIGLNDPTLNGLLTKVSELELKRDELSRVMASNSPMLQSIDSQIKTIKGSINENIQTMRQQLTSSRNHLLANNQRLEGMIRTVPGKERTLLNITRQQVIKNGLYTYLLQKREETALSAASTVSDSRIVDAARTDERPVAPVKTTIFLIFGCIGLLIPIAFFEIKDALNDRVMRRSDVEEFTQVPILGEIVKGNKIITDNLVFKPQMRSVIGEQIRALRTNLHFLKTEQEKNQVLLFTSCISGEGKSFISLNLGASLAMVDHTTVILEMDLRKPQLHKNLHMENQVGLSDYLIGKATIDELLQPIMGYTNYFIITAGPILPNPAELLSSPRLGQLFQELKQRFDYILVDSPPIGLVTDSQLIAPFADVTLFMVRHDHTPKNHLKMVDALYKEQRFQNLSIILNAIGEGESHYYNNSYGEYYGGSDPKRQVGKGKPRSA
ncbi:GumC family protein [Larkinella terrae]|uniref:Polysaccharide biosynthesis tyrosine autokinase n=1 Tax=Larkinella terrae TaxID=2025311 RepID=A0A7K0EFV9_9BACT|nr:polysaccharide biosynthesis tyrosine autokinase [Larkinella terrae]MRS60723.1 polysaccharide biosynthesis tyrosine autokinase [Larkinella terrae]